MSRVMNILMPISIYAQCVAITAFLGSVNSFYQSCISERCFTVPGSNEKKNFEGAKDWCKQRNSSLAVVNDANTQEALVQFLNSAELNEQPKPLMFIDLHLKQKDRTWYLVNGIQYLGGIEDQGEYDYLYYGYMKVHSGVFKADGSKPNNSRNFICEFENTTCSNNSASYFNYTARCFVKFENENLTWYKARERCHNNSGDLATFNYPAGTGNWPKAIPFSTFWLNPSLSYWFGIRWREWQWKSSGAGDEAIYTFWSTGQPNTYSNECVCIDPNGDPLWSWRDCSCYLQTQFVCLKIVPTTIAATTATTPSTATSSGASVSSTNITNSPSTSQINGLALGLGVGIGGGVFLILLVIIIVLVVTLIRKRRRKNNGVESRPNGENARAVTTPNIELTTPNGPDIYAHVVPTNQHPAKDKPQNDVIYAQPEFSNNQNSTSSGSDPSNLLQGRVQSIMLEGSSDLYANATSAS